MLLFGMSYICLQIFQLIGISHTHFLSYNPNFKRVFDSFNEFSDFDKDTFEALAINAIKNRKALQLGPLENQTLQQYLSE